MDLLITVSGHVQGVGFRWWTQAHAARLGLHGYAKNLPTGDVEVRIRGAAHRQQALLELLREQPSTAQRPGTVTSVDSRELPADGELTDFDVH